MTKAIITMDDSAVTMMPMVKTGLRNSCSGSIGCDTDRSCAISATRKAAPRPKQPSASGAVQELARCTKVMPSSSGVQDSRISSAPSQSIFGRLPGSGSRRSWK